MSVKDIFREHIVQHKGTRKGQTTQVVLRPYKKNSAFRVALSGAGNTADVEIACSNLDEVASYLERGGFLVRMRSEKPRVEGLYASSDVRIIR